MNIGLILLLGSFLVGADNENSEKPTEKPISNNEKTTLNEIVVSKTNQDDLLEIKPDNNEPIQNQSISLRSVNKPPILSGEPKKHIKQDEHYSFMVQASDPENDKLNPHLIKEGIFFTGLYLEGDEYFYYYNGLKSKEFSSIKKSEIETLGSDMFFALASTDKKKSILFRYEKGGDYSNYIEPEKSPLTHCEKTITDSQNQNTIDSLKLDLVCETVSKFKEDFRLGDGSIYYRINNVNDIHVDYCEEPNPK